MHAYIRAHTHVSTYKYLHTYIYLYLHIYRHNELANAAHGADSFLVLDFLGRYACLYLTRMYVCMHACMCVYACLCVCVTGDIFLGVSLGRYSRLLVGLYQIFFHGRFIMQRGHEHTRTGN